MAKEERVVACSAKPERKPREKKAVIVEQAGNSGEWLQFGQGFPDTAAAEKFLVDEATEGRYRILTVQRELTVKKVERVVLEEE